MGYYNPILTVGIESFCETAAAAGIDGLIVPDLPPEEAGPLQSAASKCGVSIVPLIALTSTEERIAGACKIAGGFIYCTAVSGVTGVRDSVSDRVETLVATARKHTELPLAVGFGISSPRNVADVARFADGAIVGSALINTLEDGPAQSAPNRAAAFVRELIGGARLQGMS
jgi:tryptophan synthase alpha chain